MGLYDDEEIVGAEAAVAERQRSLGVALGELVARLRRHEELILSASRPRARTDAMAPLAAEAEAAVAAARVPRLSDDNARLAGEVRAIVEAAREAEQAQAVARRRDERVLLRDVLDEREREIDGGGSLPSVARAHLDSAARRLRELAEAGDPEAATLAARAERRARELTNDAPAASPSSDTTPAWPDVEAAVTLWLHQSWRESAVRVAQDRPGLAATLAGVAIYDLELSAWSVAEHGAARYRLHVTLIRRGGQWLVERCAVRVE